MRFSLFKTGVALFVSAGVQLSAWAVNLPGPVVEADWLIANKDQVQVLEVRADLKSFASKAEVTVDKASGQRQVVEVGGRIPGALSIDFSKIRVTRKMGDLMVPAMIPEQAAFQSLIQAAGVNADKPIVIVPMGLETDDVDQALRLYWQFKVYGEDDMAVLNGGYASWLLEGRAWSREASAANGNWSVKADRSSQYFATSEDVAKAQQAKSATLVDSRDAPLFHGLVKRDYVFGAGHIEGAKLYPTDLMFRSGGGALKFLAPATYRGLLAAQGIDDKAAAITYCNSGHLSSGPWFLMSEVLGNKQVKLYDGSLHQWTLEKRPLAGAVPLQ